MNCENCVYWGKHTERIWGRVPEVNTRISGNRIELRPCNFILPPHTAIDTQKVYTSPKHSCDCYKEQKNMKLGF